MIRLLASLALVAAVSVSTAHAQGGRGTREAQGTRGTPGTAEISPGAAARAEVRPAAAVNLNTATAADLEKLPGIGAKVAARIVEYRQKKGPYRKIEELMNVQGIGEKSFLKLRSQITVGAPPEVAASRR
jgi:competence ComEA-like helix-hairpin-helix protein